MAAIRKRGKYWHVQVVRKGFPPQYRRFDTKAEAEQWSLRIESQMTSHLFVSNAEAERTTLEEALIRYRDEVTVRKKGAKQENSKIKVWLSRPIVKRYLATLRSSEFAQIRDEMREAGKAENTIRLHLTIISHLFETARKEWGMEALRNPIQLITKPGGSTPRDRRLDADEEKRLLAACKESKSEALESIVKLALETGCCLSELLSMQWQHVDLRASTVTLPVTKNGEQCVVPLSRKAKKVLEQLSKSDDDRVLHQWRNVWSFEHAWRRAVERAELPNFRFHDLRHEATSRFFEKGLNPMEVATITGHKSLQMLKRYTHLRAEDLAKKLN